MKIQLHEISIGDIVKNYVDNQEEGVIGYDGKLNIRPKYQREFIYDDKKRAAVIESVYKGFPLNVMYWVKNNDNNFEVLDGQQRTISICQYINNDFSITIDDSPFKFHNLLPKQKEQILDYKLMIYFCEGDDDEKLKWFQTINIAGEKLTDQELRNAIYTGPWLTDAKIYFSKNGCKAFNIGKSYIIGSPIRQEYLETVLKWISNGNIKEYMRKNQHNENASELWQYFQSVINWIKIIFPNYRKEMKGVNWGELYNKYGNNSYNAVELEEKVKKFMQDEDVTKKSGIYPYLLTGEEKYLSIRAFTDKNKREAYERQNGICVKCGEKFELSEMEADHITPWSEGGPTTSENCQMLCKDCNRRKSNK